MMRQVFGLHGVPQVVHADRGTSMTSKTVAQLLADLRGHPVPLPPAGVERQPVLRGLVQDLEVRTRRSPNGSAPWPTRSSSWTRSSTATTTTTATPASACTPPPTSTTATPPPSTVEREATLAAARRRHPERFATERSPKIINLTRRRLDQPTAPASRCLILNSRWPQSP